MMVPPVSSLHHKGRVQCYSWAQCKSPPTIVAMIHRRQSCYLQMSYAAILIYHYAITIVQQLRMFIETVFYDMSNRVQLWV